MSQAQAAAAIDRLPWLDDEPEPVRSRPPRERFSYREIAGWAFSAILVVAGISYWLGVHSWRPAPEPSARETATTLAVPQPRPSEQQSPQTQPQVVLEPQPQPQVAPAPISAVPAARRRPERRFSARHVAVRTKRAHRSPVVRKIVIARQTAAPPAAIPQSRALALWPATQSQGAGGRIVRIGSFGSRQQAKLGWRYMVRAYPAVAHLPATVVETRNSRGRPFYRFQIGTTSQAHSEVLCQRMGRIRFSCAVVGLPWKPRGVER